MEYTGSRLMGSPHTFRIGADENGLGARLGPMVVTAVMARVDERGARALGRRLPRAIRADLDDSKRLVAHGQVALAEAWARVLTAEPSSPSELLERVADGGVGELLEPCPSRAKPQCWSPRDEAFGADGDTLARLRGHVSALAERGIELDCVRSRILCTKVLNTERANGHNRFVADLHAMERLVLGLRERAGTDVDAVCGKVGGMGKYSRFFGPLSGWLHSVVHEGRASSAYRFPGVGQIEFRRDADGSDPLVMLASLVGKYLRELLMGRITAHYGAAPDGEIPIASGYNDPVTARFVDATQLVRTRRGIPATCFERDRDAP